MTLDSIHLDSNGNSKICDFKICINYHENMKSRYANKDGTVNETCEELKILEYRSPECLILEGRIEQSADFWALGISIFKMLSGFFPFLNEKSIKNDEIPDLERPETSREAKKLIKNLLNKNQFKRLGSKKQPFNIKSISFFKEINLESLEKGEVDSPFKPNTMV